MNKKLIFGTILLSVLTISYCGESETKKEESKPENEKKESKKKEINSMVKVTEGVVVRSGPGKEFQKANCTEFTEEYDKIEEGKDGWECHSTCSRSVTALNPGTEIKIIGSSDSPVKVDKWTNYWYKIETKEPFYCEGEVWIFGEFVK